MRLWGVALVLILVFVPANADREIITLDCKAQLHFMSGTPVAVSMGFKDLDNLFNHLVAKFKDRLACACGEAMDPDEFLRKYHPLPALLNLFGNTQTKATETCNTKYSMLHEDIINFSKDVNEWLSTGMTNGILPCAYTDFSTTGCAFKFAAKSTAKVDMDLAVAMKMCPDSNMPFISVVAQGSFADSVFKPCSKTGNTQCSASSKCKDILELDSESASRRDV